MCNGARTAMVMLALLGVVAASTRGHETDQFALPLGRRFADVGPFMSRWMHGFIDKGVAIVNEDIRLAIENQRGESAVAAAQDPDRLVRTINGQMPWAMDVIEGLERQIGGGDIRNRFPGQITSHRQFFGGLYHFVSFPLDPRQLIRMFHSLTINVYGIHLGTDKIGHFTDMGMNYYRSYYSAIRGGEEESEALRRAFRVGTHNPILSERGFLGYVTAGSYSNADLVANYVGMLFYRNLVESIVLKGELRPPMVVREGDYWRIADHVRPDSDFFAMFVSEHLDESLNPSVYDVTMRGGIRRNVQGLATAVLERHVDRHGNRRPRQYFEQLQQELTTYWGAEYGHKGSADQIVSIANTCFPELDETDPAARDGFGFTPLHQAAAEGDVEAIRRLLARGAVVDARVESQEAYSSEWGNMPLHQVATGEHLEAVEALLAAGASVNARNLRGQTPLHRAVTHPAVTAMLLRAGAEVNARDVRGQTPLHWAAFDPDAPAVKVLLEAGADANARDRQGHTPLHRAAVAANAGAVGILLQYRANQDAADKLGATPLHLAARHRSTWTLRKLLEGGANVNARDHFGCTPLHDASQHGSEQVVSMLLAAGGNASQADAYGGTPLHLATRQGRVGVTTLLVEGGANVNARNSVGFTPLHESAQAGQRSLVRLLLARGARATEANREGHSPADLANERGFWQITQDLRAGGSVER